MNIREIIDDLTKSNKLPWNRKKAKKERAEEMELEGDEEEESPAKESFVSGSTGPIPGINRKWVRGGAIFFAAVFIIAFLYASNSKKPDTATPQQIKQSKDIANGQQASNRAGAQDAPDSYEGLINSNKKAAQGKTNGNTTQAQRTNPGTQQQPAQETVQAQQSTVPAIAPRVMTPLPSYSQAYSLPSQAPAVQATPQPAASEDKGVVDNVKDKFKAAIAFALGDGSPAGSTGSSGASAPAATSAAPAAGGTGAVNAASTGGSVNGTYSAPSANTISTGTIIPVMLLTGINTDTPGQVMAQVQSDVYDYMGSNLLIPAGSRLMGTYDQKMVNDRVNITFSSLQTPDGGTWSIGNSIVAVDGAGYMGITGEVHRHTAKKFGAGLLKSALNAISTLGASNVTVDTSAFTDVADGTIKNTLTVEPGYQFQVYVTNNIAF